MIIAKLQQWSSNEYNSVVGVTTSGRSVLQGCSFRKVENHCFRVRLRLSSVVLPAWLSYLLCLLLVFEGKSVFLLSLVFGTSLSFPNQELHDLFTWVKWPNHLEFKPGCEGRLVSLMMALPGFAICSRGWWERTATFKFLVLGILPRASYRLRRLCNSELVIDL